MAGRSAPARGDIIWVSPNPQAGHEQKDRRPALVLSPAAYNRRVGLAICCPITTRVKSYPFEVLVPAGLPVTGAILSDQVRTLDWRGRQARLICKAPHGTTRDVLLKLGALLAPDES